MKTFFFLPIAFLPKLYAELNRRRFKEKRNAVPLEDAMKKELQSHKHSLENPAFVERPKLKKILMEF